MSSYSPLIKFSLPGLGLCLVDTFLKINFLDGGKIINKPNKSVAKPGKIKSNAANA